MKYKEGDKVFVECIFQGINNEGDPVVKPKDWGLTFAVSENDIHAGTYEDGLADAWYALKKIICSEDKGGIPYRDIGDMFRHHGGNTGEFIMLNYTPQEVIDKIKEWDDSQIKRGDEVCSMNGTKGIVIRESPTESGHYYIIWNDFSCGGHDRGRFTKTGRNFADKLDDLWRCGK